MEARDDKLWRALRERSTDAYEELEERVQATCPGVLRRLGAPSESLPGLLQDVLVSVWEFAESHAEEPRNLTGFLVWRARGVWTTHLRSRGRATSGLEVAMALAADESEPLETLATEELVGALGECREELRGDQAAVWEARYERDLDTVAAAEVLRKTRDQIALLLHRARRRLEACLRRKGVLS